ncbi:MAG: ABC transporter permease [Caldilineales bacterium]|nr:ABC transporter permease [Caldilineales bacterium]
MENTNAISSRLRGNRRIDPLILALLVALALLIAIIGVQKPDIFFHPRNILNIGQAITLIGLVTLAQTVVIIMGGLDLSVGSIVGLVSIFAAFAMRGNDNLALGIMAGLLVGAAAGLINGMLITRGHLEPVIATLGTLAVYRGAAFILTNGAPIGIMSDVFNKIGSGQALGIPVPVIILVVVIVAFQIFLTRTDFGRNVYSIGGNDVAARLSGINISGYKLGIYTLSGATAALAGIVLTARSNAGQPNAAIGLELESVTAAVLGGTALTGGKGTVIGAMLGVLILGVLNNGMILLGVSQFYQFVAKGALLIIAVFIQRWLMERE